VPRDAAAVLIKTPTRPALPNSGPNSAMRSLPRKDWPCRFVERHGVSPTSIETRFTYGKRDTCLLPGDVVGMRGVVGCPERIDQRNLQNKVEMGEIIGYDSTGHLNEIVLMDGGRFVYAWDGDIVVSRTVRGRAPGAYASYPDHVVVTDGEVREAYEVDGRGRVVTYKSANTESTFTWKGTRLASYTGVGAYDIEYHCRKPARP
jgi:hypothetical protein